MEAIDTIKLLVDRGLAFTLCAIFLVAIVGMLRLGFQFLNSKLLPRTENTVAATVKTETDTYNKALIILSSLLTNAGLTRLNLMRFYYDDGNSLHVVYMCGKVELLGRGALSLGGALCHISAESYPVFLSLLRRDGQVMLDGANRNPDFFDSVYELHDAKTGKVFCVAIYDIGRTVLGYIFARKEDFDEGDIKVITDTAINLGVLLGDPKGVL